MHCRDVILLGVFLSALPGPAAAQRPTPPTQARLAAMCTGPKGVVAGLRPYSADWIEVDVPDSVAQADSLHPIGIDDQWFDLPPGGYTITGDPGLARAMREFGILDARNIEHARDSGAGGAGAVAIECPRVSASEGPAILVIAMSSYAPGIYHLFAYWDSTAAHPAIGARARARDASAARLLVRSLRQARIRRPVEVHRGAPSASRIDSVTRVSVSIEQRLGCSDGPRSSEARDSLLLEVAAARVRWTQARPARAQYRVSVGGGMTLSSPSRVTLIGDSVVMSLPRPGVEGPSLGPTWLFARAEAAARTPAGRVEIEFDRQYALPIRILMDPDDCMTDDAVEVSVTDFVVSTSRP